MNGRRLHGRSSASVGPPGRVPPRLTYAQSAAPGPVAVLTAGGAAMSTVMSWNVENLLTRAPSGRADFDAELDALAAVTTVVQPDAVASQEVGDEPALERCGPGWARTASASCPATGAVVTGDGR